MPIVTIELQLSSDDLLNAVRQLSDRELDLFVSQVLVLQEQRRGIDIDKNEPQILPEIARNILTEKQKRYAELLAKREAKTLTPKEYRELIYLIKQVKQ
jgi:hypothetical protein